MIPINLAVEDELSESVLRRLLSSVEREFAVGRVYGRGGFGYLRRTIRGWNSAAVGVPFCLLTDLDDAPCPLSLIQDWLSTPPHPNLLFRVAVREVESWLLADADGIAGYLRVNSNLIPSDPDSILDPKGFLVGLAAESRSSEIRSTVAPKRGSTAKQGPAYNTVMSCFVAGKWNIDAASARSSSLARTVSRFSTFTPHWNSVQP